MGRILITGSADGLGAETARRLVAGGHDVVVHARDDARLADAREAVPGAAGGVAADLSSLAAVEGLAPAADALGPFDCVVHNAGLYVESERHGTADGLPRVVAVNVMAPYVLTARMARPARLVYLTSGLHRGGTASVEDLDWTRRRWDGMGAYADTKLWDIMLARAVSRRFSEVVACAVGPGWVRTKMGGPSAPRGLEEGTATQVWVASGEAPAPEVDGAVLEDRRPASEHPDAADAALQDALLSELARRTGVELG